MLYQQALAKCPLCGYCGKITAKSGNIMDFSDWKAGDEVVIIQEIAGGKVAGTGKGYRGSADPVPPVTVATYTLDDIVKGKLYPKVLDDIKNQTLVVVRELIRLGVVNKSMI